jgi:hypothetical protein
MVIYGERFYETQTQFPEGNIVQDSESSNKVCLRMEVTYFFAIGHKHYESKWHHFKLKMVFEGQKSYEKQTQIQEENIVQKCEPCNYIGYRMAGTCFIDLDHNWALWAQWVRLKLKQGIDEERFY